MATAVSVALLDRDGPAQAHGRGRDARARRSLREKTCESADHSSAPPWRAAALGATLALGPDHGQRLHRRGLGQR